MYHVEHIPGRVVSRPKKVSAMIISHLESEAVFDETAVGPYVIRSSLLVELKSYAVVEGGDFTGSY